MKTIFATIFSIGIIGTCLGQGTVTWDSIPFNAMTAQTNSGQLYFGGGSNGGGTVGNTAPANTGLKYYYELLYNTSFTGSQVPVPGSASLFGGTWLDTGLTATNGNTAGRLVPVNPNTASVVPWASGTTNNIMLVGWSANLGNSWLIVSNELATGTYFAPDIPYFGESATGYLSPKDPPFGDPGASVFGTSPTANGLPINSLNTQLFVVAPEPGTLSLAGLGALSLLLFRRRRR